MLRDFAEERCGGRLISTLGGGYNPETLAGLTVSHVAEFSRD
jgi:hypothetical protein